MLSFSIQLQLLCLSLEINSPAVCDCGWSVVTVCVKRNESYIMTHSACHGSINQLQLLLWSITECLCLISTPPGASNRHLSTLKKIKDDLPHFCTLFPLGLISVTPERYSGGGSGWWAAKPELVLVHSKREREDEGVWRNAAVQTALWFSGHGAQCDSLWLKQRGDHSDVHPSGPAVFCSLSASVCAYERQSKFKCVQYQLGSELDDFYMW